MTSPKSIFTAPESFKRTATQSSLNLSSKRRLSTPDILGSECKSKPIVPPGQAGICGQDDLFELPGQVEEPINSALDITQKRSFDRIDDSTTVDEPNSKRARICSFPSHTVSRADFEPHILFETLPTEPPTSDPATPTSPLFFSNSRAARPLLPPRFSSGEAGSRMLSQAGHAEDKIKTVTLARASYSGQSPPGSIGLPSHRASLERSNTSLTGTISPEESRHEASKILGDVGVVELLEQDFRPTFIVDLGDSANYSPGPLRIIFLNSSLRSNLALSDFVQGRGTDASPRSEPLKGYPHFKAWLLSATFNGESLDVCLPAFVNGGVSWSCSTLRKRLRIASAGPTSTPSHSDTTPGGSAHSSIPLRVSSGKAPSTSSGSMRRVPEEPEDYFGDAVPSPRADPHTQDVVQSVESGERSDIDTSPSIE
jgi:hypothetical protein